MRFVLAVLGFVAIAIAAQGCGPSCESGAPNNFKACSNDPNPTQNEIASCKLAQAGPCSGKYNDWIGCVKGKIQCDPVSRQSMPDTVLKGLADCADKKKAYDDCASTTM